MKKKKQTRRCTDTVSLRDQLDSLREFVYKFQAVLEEREKWREKIREERMKWMFALMTSWFATITILLRFIK